MMPATRAQIAPLLRVLRARPRALRGFPWKIPADALAVPRHGIVNGHPSLLPRYRGPSPVSWAIRNGETEIGFTFHYMDAELDTGGILAQATIPLGDEHSWEELEPTMVGGDHRACSRACSSGSSGAIPAIRSPRRTGPTTRSSSPSTRGSTASRRARRSLDRCARGGSTRRARATRGALLERDGETVRVLRVSREPADGPPLECADGTLWIVEEEAA